MKKYEKEVQQAFLNNEEAVIKRLKQVYNKSSDDITKKIATLDASIADLQKAIADVGEDEIGDLAAAFLKGKTHITPEEAKETLQSMLQSKVYQRNYQKALKKQVGDILDTMHKEEFKTVSDYLVKCYDEGFMGAMYSLQNQGIPMCFPIDQKAMVKAVQLDSKISKGLYQRLGEDVALLKRKITAQVSRGIATGMSFQQVAQQLASVSKIGYNNAIRVSRTEGHRIQIQSADDACRKAKEKGADIVRQWDAALDKRTRDSHARVDGEIRELDEPFSNGLRFPGDPHGAAAEVINCRCALLQRAKWALDEEELETLKERAAYFGIDKADSFDDFKKKYLKAAEKVKADETAKSTFVPAKTKQEAVNFAKRFDVDADYSSYDISVANAVNETMLRSIDEFGEHALDKLRTIGTFEKGNNVGAGGYNIQKGTLKLRGVRGKDALSKMGKNLTKFQNGYFSTDSDLHLIRHEIGHAIYDSLGSGVIDHELTMYRRQRKDELRKRGEPIGTLGLSYYATEENHEFVAEAVAQYLNGNPSTTALDVIDILLHGKLTRRNI